jgi:RNA-directed DNA polymerase
VQEGGFVMSATSEAQPATVSVAAPQAGNVRDRWSWAAPAVWTERMLTALEQGVKGGIWFSLMDKVYARRNLEAAAQHVASNKGAAGVDHVTVDQFSDALTTNLDRLHDELRRDVYTPQAIRRHWIPKPGSPEGRPLGIPTVRDRVVQTALRHVLEPIFERDFATHSYGFRPQRGCKDALRRVQELLQAGYVHVVDADLKSYFDTIPQDRLLDLIRRKVADSRVLALLDAFLKQGVLEGLSTWTPEQGTPQGAVISPLLANIYLDPLDHHMAEKGYAMVRYADDFVILCRSADEAARALAEVQAWVAQAGLQLHPSKTKVVHAEQEGFDFLGYHFRGSGKRWPRQKSRTKLYDNLRSKTRRKEGRSLAVIIADVNRTLVGWFGYFKHSLRTALRQVDSWVRMRLRSILRRRKGLCGRGRGADHQRWPNAYFATQGLFSLVTAHELACQSPRG